MKSRTAKVVVLKLTTIETFVLAAVLAAVEGVQVNVAMSTQAHAAVAVAVLMLGALVSPITPAQFLAKIPLQVVSLVQALLGALLIVAQSFPVGSVAVTAIGVVVVVASTLGIGPRPAPPAVRRTRTPAARRAKK